MDTKRVLARNIASNWAGYALQVVVTFFLTPYVLAALGQDRFGAWAIVTSLTGYYGLIDLGLRGAVTQYLARYLAVRDFARMNESASTAMLVLNICAVAVAILSIVVATFLPALFDVADASTEREMSWAILAMGLGSACQFALFTYSAVFPAAQRYDLANIIGAVTRLIAAGSTLLALHLGYGLVGISVATAGANTLDYLIRFAVAHRVVPELRVSWRSARVAQFREFLTFSGWNVVIALASRLANYASSILIGLFITAAAVTPYATALSLVQYFYYAFSPIGGVFFPMATYHDARGDRSALRRAYLVGTRLTMVLVVPAAVIAAYAAEDFGRLWLGAQYPIHDGVSMANVFVVLVVGYSCLISRHIGSSILMGARHLRQMATIGIFESMLMLTLSAALIPMMGIMGSAIGTSIGAAVTALFVQPALIGRVLGIPTRTYLVEVWLRPLVILLLMPGIVLAVRYAIPAVNWPQLILQGLVAGVLGLAAAFAVGLRKTERQNYVMAPATLILRRVGRLGTASK